MILEASFDIDPISNRDWYWVRSYGSSDDLVYISIFPLPLFSVGRETEKESSTLEHWVGTDIPDESDLIDCFHIVDSYETV